jgi:hypothetical protein
MEATRCSETSVFTRATWRNIPANGILHSHCREKLKSYNEEFLSYATKRRAIRWSAGISEEHIIPARYEVFATRRNIP